MQRLNLFVQVPTVEDEDRTRLLAIEDGQTLPKDATDSLKKRKAIEPFVVKFYAVKKGPNFTTERKKKEADLTAEMILKGTWENLEFKKYNFNALGKEISTGDQHPLLKVKQQFQNILLGMGFVNSSST